MKEIFITGTDTGVGKSVISYLFMDYLQQVDKKSTYLKIFQTGCKDVFDIECDAYFVYKNISSSIDREFLQSKICYLLKAPKSPYFAALNEGKEIDTLYVYRWIKRHKRENDIIILEGAGGLMVPITRDFFMIDLIKNLKCEVVLVSRPSLGTINHTLLSVEALKNRNIKLNSIIFSNYGEKDMDLIQENKKIISHYSGADVYIVGEIKNNQDTKKYYGIVRKIFKEL